MDINYTDPILKSLFFVAPPPLPLHLHVVIISVHGGLLVPEKLRKPGSWK